MLESQCYLEGDFEDTSASSGTTLNPRVVLLQMVIGGDDENSGDRDCDVGDDGGDCDRGFNEKNEEKC